MMFTAHGSSIGADGKRELFLHFLKIPFASFELACSLSSP
jgi:hypothetical protein